MCSTASSTARLPSLLGLDSLTMPRAEGISELTCSGTTCWPSPRRHGSCAHPATPIAIVATTETTPARHTARRLPIIVTQPFPDIRPPGIYGGCGKAGALTAPSSGLLTKTPAPEQDAGHQHQQG